MLKSRFVHTKQKNMKTTIAVHDKENPEKLATPSLR